MSQTKPQVGVPTQSTYQGNLSFRTNQQVVSNIAYHPRAEDFHNSRRQNHQIQQQQRHHGPVPSNSPGVPSPSASPGARRTPPHEMSKQGVRQQTIVGPQAGVNMLPPQQYRMQHQAGQLHHGVGPQTYGIPGSQRPTPLQATSVPPVLAAQGNSGTRLIPPTGANASPFIQNQNFVAGHQMLPAPMAQFAPRASGQFSTPGAPYQVNPYYFPATPALQQNQGYYPGAGQIPPQTNYNPSAVMAPQPTTRQEPQRRKRILRIQDPTSGEDVTDSIMREGIGGSSVSTQGSATGSVGTQPQQQEGESNEKQISRRIQAEFLSKVSQAANDESGTPPPAAAPTPVVQAPPAVTPVEPESSQGEPSQAVTKPPVKEETVPVATVPEAASPAVNNTAELHVQPEVVPTKEVPPAVVTTENVQPPVETDELPTPPTIEPVDKPEPAKEVETVVAAATAATVPVSSAAPPAKPASAAKNKKKKMQELDKKPVTEDMFEAFRSPESSSEPQKEIAATEEVAPTPVVAPPPVVAVVAPPPVVAPPSQNEEAEKPSQEQKTEEENRSGADEETVIEKNLNESTVAPKSDNKQNNNEIDNKTEEKEESKAPEKQTADLPQEEADLPKEEASVNNVNSVPVEVSKAPEETVVEEKKLKDENEKKVEDENAKNKEGEPKPEDNKIGLKYTYREDQWSPLNQEGKKQYDRGFLLQFQPDCTSKPQGLPDIPDIVLEKADVRPHLDTKSMTSKGPDNLFMPNYMKSPRINQNPPSFPSGGKRQSKERKVISRPSTSTEEKLKRSENAWKPDTFKKKVEESANEDEDLLRRFKSILNKLTPQNFQKLMNQTMQLPINSEERLKGVIDLVFEKAIMEPGFSQAYANMCRVMQSIEVKKTDGEPVQFRKLILIKCQKQFERDRSDEQVEKEKQRIMALTNEKEKEEALTELEYQQMIVKKQIVGNIRFIGELFKLQLLTEKIMQNCIFLLLKAKDEESLECMCKLVSTVGQSLDHVKGKALMDQYFHQVDKIIKEKKVSSRIRFMLQDLKDLRESNWKPRRNEAKPVMIDQIRKEAEQEKQRKEQEQLAARLAPRPNKRPPGSMEKYQQEDGWNTVPGGRSTKQNVIENPSKLKITRQNYDENVQLGPGGRPGSFGGWGKGSSGGGGGGGKTSSGSSDSKVPQANRFQMLGEDKSSRSMLPPRDSNKSRSSSSSKRSRERDIDRSRERQAAIAETQRFTGSQRSRSSELDRNQEKRPEPAAPMISEEEYEKRSKATIDEYLSVKDFKEVTACIKELKSPKLQHVFIRVAIESVLEKKAHMRETIGRLFHRLLDASTISVEQFKVGLKEILEFADDMAIDIPLYWTYLGEIIGGMAAEGAQNFAFLKDSVQMVQEKAAKFMAEIMKAGVNYTSEQQMSSVWQASSFTWDMFLPEGSNVHQFLTDNNLTFTEKPVERASQIPPKEENRIGNFQRDLMLFQKENFDNNAAFDFIEESIPPELRKTKEFIRALVSAVCYGAVKGEGTNSRGDHELLKNRTVLMQRYIDGNPELELQALYAVQHLNNSLENPPGLLRLYFDVLYDEDVISEDTFYAWRDSQDPSEKNGKGIALKSVTSFYTWLEESDPPS